MDGRASVQPSPTASRATSTSPPAKCEARVARQADPHPPHPQRHFWLVIAAFTSLYFFWGSTYLGIRWAVLQDGGDGFGFPPFFMAGMRNGLAGVILYVAMRWWRGLPRPTLRHWVHAAVVGTLLLLGGNGLVTFASQRIVSGVVALMVGMLPIWLLLLEGVWGGPPLRERLRPALLLGIALGIGGVALLMWPKIAAAWEGAGAGGAAATASLPTSHRAEAIGFAALILSSFSWANGSLYSRRTSAASPRSPLMATGMTLLCGGAVLLLVSALAGEWGLLSRHAALGSPRPVLSLAYLIVFGSLVGYTAYIWLLEVTTPAKVATYAYVNPVVAVALGAWLGGERLTLSTLGAAAVIIAGVVVIVTFRGKPAAASDIAEELTPPGVAATEGDVAMSRN